MANRGSYGKWKKSFLLCPNFFGFLSFIYLYFPFRLRSFYLFISVPSFFRSFYYFPYFISHLFPALSFFFYMVLSDFSNSYTPFLIVNFFLHSSF